MITPSQASLKYGQETCSLPFSLGKHQWLRVILGQAKRAELRSSYEDSSIDKNQVFKTMEGLKGAHGEEVHNVHHFYCMPLLRLMKAKMEKKDRSIETAGKSSIGSFIKTRLSERNPVRASLVPFRAKHEISSTHAELSRNKISKTFETLDRRDSTTVHTELRKGASTIEAGRFLHRQCPSQLKESNTSTSIGGEPDIKFSRKMRKIKEITENKATKSMKQPLFDGSCGLFPSSRPKPKFY